MLDGFHILTLTHKQAPLADLGKAMIDDARRERMLNGIRKILEVEELYYLATCNRVMYLYYSSLPAGDNPAQVLIRYLHPDWTAAETAEFALGFQAYQGTSAVRHLMEVASSMDSLVVGEREIIRQLREAFEQCRDWGLTGDHLRLLMRYTIESAKAVYTETRIGEKALSVVALAFQALQAQGLPRQARIVMVGAGRTNALFAKFLFKYGYRNVTVFNRTLEHAEVLAGYLEGNALPLHALPDYRGGFDALVVCTGAGEPIVTASVYQGLLAGEPGVKVAVDLSVPNNIDPALPEQFPLRIIDIEGLRGRAQENLAHRERERERASELIEQRVYAFREVWHERQVERSLSNIPSEIRQYKERALNEVFGKELDQLDEQTLHLVHRMMDYMEKKAIAVPMKTVKSLSIGGVKRTAANH